MRAPIFVTAFAFVAGAALAAPPVEPPVEAPRFDPPAVSTPLSTDRSSEGLVAPIDDVAPAEEIVIARKGHHGGGHRGGGHRGGARHKSHGGFHAGNQRHHARHGGSPRHHGHHDYHHHGHGHHDLDIDRNVDVDINDNDDKWGAALVGGVVGMGIGAAINNQSQPQYYPPPQQY